MQQFLTEVVEQTAAPDQAYRAVYAFSALSKPEESATLIENTMEKWLSRKLSGASGPDLSPSQVIETVFDVAMTDSENQNRLSPLLRQMLDAVPQDGHGNVDTLMLSRLQGLTMTETFKKEMRGYIETIQLAPNSESRYYDLLMAKEAVAEVPATGGPGCSIIATIAYESNPIKVASVVAFANQDILRKISAEDARRYQTMLKAAANLSGRTEDAQLAGAALERLGEVLSETLSNSKRTSAQNE
jgi:hypothetical protein